MRTCARRHRRQRRLRAALVLLLALALAPFAAAPAGAASPIPDKPVATWRRPAPEIDEVLLAADLALEADGGVLLLDTYGCRVIRFTPAGEVRGAFGGCGREPGRLFQPDGLAVAPSGTIYVAERRMAIRRLDDPLLPRDRETGRVQAFDADGRWRHAVTTSEVLGSPSGSYWLPARLHDIGGIAVGVDGLLRVLDAGGARLSRYDAEGRLLSAAWVPGSTAVPGPPIRPPAWASAGLAMQPDGRIAWADGTGSVWQIEEDAPSGLALRRLVASTDRRDGPRWQDLQPAEDGGWWLLDDRRLRRLDADGVVGEDRILPLPAGATPSLAVSLVVRPGGSLLLGMDLRGETLGYGTAGVGASLYALRTNDAGAEPLWGRAPAPSAWSLGALPGAVVETAEGQLALLTHPWHVSPRRPYPESRTPLPDRRPASGLLRLDHVGAITLDRLDPSLGPDGKRLDQAFPSGIAAGPGDGLVVADPAHRRLVRYDAVGDALGEISLDEDHPVSLRGAPGGRVLGLGLDGVLRAWDAEGYAQHDVSLPMWDGTGMLAMMRRRPASEAQALPFGLTHDGARAWLWDVTPEDEGYAERFRAFETGRGEPELDRPVSVRSPYGGIGVPGDLRLGPEGEIHMLGDLGCGPTPYDACVGRFAPESGALVSRWPVQDPASTVLASGKLALPADGRLLVARSDYGRMDPRGYDHRMEIAVWDRDWPTTWRAEAFANPYLAGRPAETRAVADPELPAWHAGLPAGGSGRLERPLTLEGGTYDVRLAVPGGARLWLDGELLVDAWRAEGVDEAHELFLAGTWAHRVLLELRAPDVPAGQDAFALSFARRGPSYAIHLPWTTGAWGDRPLDLPAPEPSPTPEAYPGP